MFRGRHGMEVVYGWMMSDLQLDSGTFLRSGVDRTDGKRDPSGGIAYQLDWLWRDTTTIPSLRAIFLEVLESFLAIRMRKLG